MNVTLRTALCFASLLMTAAVSASTPPVDEPAWSYDEQWLKDEEIATDPTTLRSVALQHEDPYIRFHALRVMSLRGDPETREIARQVFSEAAEPFLQMEAALSLVRVGDPSGVGKLEGLFAAVDDDRLKLRIGTELARLGNGTGWLLVQELTRHRNPAIRRDAVSALPLFVSLGRAEALEQIPALATDPDPSVRKEVVRAIGRLGPANNGAYLAPTLHALATRDPAPEVRLLATSRLRAWERSNDFSPAWLRAENPVPVAREDRPPPMVPWKESTERLDETLRQAGIDPENLRQILAAAREAEAPSVRRAAHRRLAQGDASTDTPAEVMALFRRQLQEGPTEQDRLEAGWALAYRQDPVGLDDLRRRFREARPGRQIELAVLLAALGDETGYSRLVELSRGPDEELAAGALRGLFSFLPLARDGIDPISVLQAVAARSSADTGRVLEALNRSLSGTVLCDAGIDDLFAVLREVAEAQEDREVLLRIQLADLQLSTAKGICTR